MTIRRPRLRPRIAAWLLLLPLMVGAMLMGATPAHALGRPVTVSLTFDDGTADQAAAAQTLSNLGMAGTFYIVDQWTDSPGYLSKSQLKQLALRGHEIGGHTVSHAELTHLSTDEARRQICNNRATLQSWGFRPTSLAYPYADANATVEQVAKECGYVSARGLGDVKSPYSCADCQLAETQLPADRFYLKAPDQVDSTWTLEQLKAQVTQAKTKGGWVALTFHTICAPIGAPGCDPSTSITPTLFNQFASWLATYRLNPLNLTSVRTVDWQMRLSMGLGYPFYQAGQTFPSSPEAPAGTNAVQNPSLEQVSDYTGLASCYQQGGWGANTAGFSMVSPGRTGSQAAQVTVENYQSGDAKILPTLDLGDCAPSVTPGRSYALSTWYKTTALTQFALYYRDSNGVWFYWTSSPWFDKADDWAEAKYQTPPVPAGATAITFGLAAISDGVVITDDYSMVYNPTDSSLAAAPARTKAVKVAVGTDS